MSSCSDLTAGVSKLPMRAEKRAGAARAGHVTVDRHVDQRALGLQLQLHGLVLHFGADRRGRLQRERSRATEFERQLRLVLAVGDLSLFDPVAPGPGGDARLQRLHGDGRLAQAQRQFLDGQAVRGKLQRNTDVLERRRGPAVGRLQVNAQPLGQQVLEVQPHRLPMPVAQQHPQLGRVDLGALDLDPQLGKAELARQRTVRADRFDLHRCEAIGQCDQRVQTGRGADRPADGRGGGGDDEQHDDQHRADRPAQHTAPAPGGRGRRGRRGGRGGCHDQNAMAIEK